MKLLANFVVLLVLPCIAVASGEDLPQSLSVAGKTLYLNGSGYRKATFFKIKVYRAALYLEKKSHNPEEIINSKETKRLVMKFVRSVSKKRLQSGWRDGFRKNAEDYFAIEQQIKAFNQMMPDVSDGDTIVLTWTNGDTVTVTINGKKTGEIKNSNFARAIMAIWLGKNPPNQDLKEGLLGK
ncbi:MAG: hypothetical protein D6719_13280 [Candidatus Dadabacteria bacterium]|nr:MAG: hypothetical protein D6719_13280 [Candidatus Dadabacteria bacterium]